jgi:uncharacterized membrane protein YjjP (DUF1212 family)
MGQHSIQAELLATAGRLLLEYNDSSGSIQRTLAATARALSDDEFRVVVFYGGVIVSLGGEPPLTAPVRELRYNQALQARVHAILANVRDGELDAQAALDQLTRAETETPHQSPWLAVPLLGIAASALALLLGADSAAATIAGLATALGLIARQQLHRWNSKLLTLPLTAAFIGAALGGIAIRLGWTASSALALVVPSLMLIPGPHLINSLLDLIENYLPMSVARFALATGIIIASALGIVMGVELTLSDTPIANPAIGTAHLNLISDMLLAALVTCGFAVFYNAAWPHVGLAVLGGLIGHGLRYLALEAGCRLEVATFLAALAIGVIASLTARRYRVPVAVLAFAGAVTMMPGVQIYGALSGSLQLARAGAAGELPTLAGTLGDALQASLVVAAIALGLVVPAYAIIVRRDECALRSK